MRSISPFRYPGGKAFLYKYLQGRLASLPEGPRYYAEPFCGGAGADASTSLSRPKSGF
ncbi:site-specific DNA-adenine methylase [Phenylobacterium koreense]|uniref:Site-specific DNA-adenine methylase n=1 Tax=Phenylobacterium koreense TaxID=266125 RepID=A0ABV2EPC9_9CAUL